MRLSLIWAMGEDGVIGRDGGLPWHLPADLKHFMDTTRGHTVIMGRKTWETVGKPLPGRTNLVVTRNPGYRAEGAIVVPSFAAALGRIPPAEEEVFCIGGSEIYRLALPRADRLIMTLVHASPEGDTFFPELDLDDGTWRLVSDERRDADEQNEHAFSIRVYERSSRAS